MSRMTHVRMLYCGQGMATLVEVYNDGNAEDSADYLALVDCGGNDGGEAVEYIANKIHNSQNKRLDLLVISHQDKDHNELLTPLADKLDEEVTVEAIYIGGQLWGKSNRERLKKFAEDLRLSVQNSQYNAQQQSHYTGAGDRSTLGSIGRIGDGETAVFIRVLTSNTPVAQRKEDLIKNGTSAVIVIENGSYSVILPGDATYETMDWVNNNLPASRNLLPPVLATSIPHHGALRTAVEEYVARGKPDDFNWAKVQEFAGLIQSKAIGASAGHENGHHHPVEEVVQVFSAAAQDADAHTYVSYRFTERVWATNPSTKAVYTTVSSLSVSAPSILTRSQGKVFEYGDILFKITSPGVLQPKQMVEFKPRGKQGAHLAGVAPLLAPAP